MKLTRFAIAAFGPLVSTQPLFGAAPLLEERTGSSKAVLATFDDLKPGLLPALNTIPVPYANLNYSSFISQPAGFAGIAPGVIAHSSPNYAANGPLSPNRTPTLTIKGTSTTSFDLQEFWYGCLIATEVQQVQISTSCTFGVTGTKAGPYGGTAGPVSFTFTPSSLTNAQMMKASFGSDYGGLSSATVRLTSSGSGVADTVFLLDSVKYIVYSA